MIEQIGLIISNEYKIIHEQHIVFFYKENTNSRYILMSGVSYSDAFEKSPLLEDK